MRASTQDPKGKGTVLIIEDNMFFLKLQRIMLERAGYAVLAAHDGRAGVDLFARFADRVDVVVTDLLMPEINGVEVCRRIKERKPDMPVVLVSGTGEDSDIDTSLFDGTLQKPYEAKDLIALVDRLITPQPNGEQGIAHGE